MTDSICVVIGTRPSIIKASPIIRELEKQNLDHFLLHSGQHYSYTMNKLFFEELGLHEPDFCLNLEHTELHGFQTAQMLKGIEQILIKENPSVVLVFGDANFNLAGALATRKLNLDLCHTESGLRSHDWRMPEEHNRKMIDHISDLLFAPTEDARQNLIRERVRGMKFVTGNTVVDALLELMPKAGSIDVPFEEYILATAHRQENVDQRSVLQNFVEAFLEAPLPVVYPHHPRTAKRLEQFGLYSKLYDSKNVSLLGPIGYTDFLGLMKGCRLIWTDSGGVQEEATVVRKPTVVMRVSTDRPEAVSAGFAIVAGTDKRRILSATYQILESRTSLPTESPYGDGHAGQKMVQILKEVLD